jgi:hypothetical protein
MTEPPVVLYIEDNEANQKLVARILQRSPSRPRIVSARDGSQGIGVRSPACVARNEAVVRRVTTSGTARVSFFDRSLTSRSRPT